MGFNSAFKGVIIYTTAYHRKLDLSWVQKSNSTKKCWYSISIVGLGSFGDKAYIRRTGTIFPFRTHFVNPYSWKHRGAASMWGMVSSPPWDIILCSKLQPLRNLLHSIYHGYKGRGMLTDHTIHPVPYSRMGWNVPPAILWACISFILA